MTLRFGRFDEQMRGETIDLIRSLSFLNIRNGPWVAGGAVRRLLTGSAETPTMGLGFDIDVFLPSEHAPNGIVDHEKIITKLIKCSTRSDNSPQRKNRPQNIYFKTGVVQLISNNLFKGPVDLINDFDYTICMAVTDGYDWIADERFFTDNENKILAFNNSMQCVNSAYRLVKYCNCGFTPAPGVIGHILKINDAKFAESFNSDGLLQVAEYVY